MHESPALSRRSLRFYSSPVREVESRERNGTWLADFFFVQLEAGLEISREAGRSLI
jgi:hypothetical protein